MYPLVVVGPPHGFGDSCGAVFLRFLVFLFWGVGDVEDFDDE